MPLPDYIKKEYKKTRTLHGNWFLMNYRYKFNISRTKVFLKGMKDGYILGLKCRSCNTVSFPPRLICGRCLVKPDQWVRLPETGTIATGSATYAADDKDRERPLPVIAVRQDGADTTYMVELNPDVDFKDTYIGMPVKVHWAENVTGGLNDIEYYDLVEDDAKDLDIRKE